MAISKEMSDLLHRLDVETTKVGEVVRTLRDKISTSMTAEDVAAVQEKMDAVADRLEATASDPDQPIPPGPIV